MTNLEITVCGLTYPNPFLLAGNGIPSGLLAL